MSSNKELFSNKYQPIFFDDYGIDDEIIEILKTFILMDKLQILLIGNMASGKTSLLNSIIKEYYKNFTQKEYNGNIL